MHFEQVGGVKVAYNGMLMPRCMLWMFRPDLYHMFLYFEKHGGNQVDIAAFKKVVPDAFSAEDWFRFYSRCHYPRLPSG